MNLCFPKHRKQGLSYCTALQPSFPSTLHSESLPVYRSCCILCNPILSLPLAIHALRPLSHSSLTIKHQNTVRQSAAVGLLNSRAVFKKRKTIAHSNNTLLYTHYTCSVFHILYLICSAPPFSITVFKINVFIL